MVNQGSSKVKLKRSDIPVILIILITLCIVGGIIFTLYKIQTTEPNWVITDISQYSEILEGTWPDRTFVQHFPPEIPANATEAHMLYSPPFMQKGALFQLWLKLPTDEIKKVQAEYNEMALKSGVETYLSRSYPALNRYDTEGNIERHILSEGYEIIVLGAESRDGGNHGHTYGVATNVVTSEILYWTETW